MIVEQPDAYVEATVGKKLQLVIKASGVPPLKFKWYKDSKELAYGTSSVLEIPIANQLDDGQYCCSVANEYGSILSDIYQVKVLRRPRGELIPSPGVGLAWVKVSLAPSGVFTILVVPGVATCKTNHA